MSKEHNLNNADNQQLNMAGVRQHAMLWWNNLSNARKAEICDTNTWLVGSIRHWGKLTGGEIEQLFNIEYSLFLETCRNDKCVYNVSKICKCKDIGSTCISHVV